MVLVNFFGVPGAGKSTGTAYVFSKLKMLGYNAELVDEFAKGKVYEENKEAFKNQAYIFGKQFYKITRCEEKVDVILTDSPLLLSVFYNNDKRLGEPFNEMVKNVSKGYDSLNYLILRTKKYNPKGRWQSEKESNALLPKMKELMNEVGEYTAYPGDEEYYDKIVSEVDLYLRSKGVVPQKP